MRRPIRNVVTGTAAVLLMPLVLWAQVTEISDNGDPQIHPLVDIEQAVQQFISRNNESPDQAVSVKTKSLDRRLRLARCSKPLNTYWSPGSRAIGRVTVQVECESPRPWRIHVQASVTVEVFVWVLSRGARRGDVLSPELLTRQLVTLGANNAAFVSRGSPVRDLKPWIGFSFSQRVNSGQVLEERMLEPANLVSKGEVVLITHRSQGLSLQTKGIALKDAAANQQLQVRNSASGKIVDAIAVTRGTVEILK